MLPTLVPLPISDVSSGYQWTDLTIHHADLIAVREAVHKSSANPRGSIPIMTIIKYENTPIFQIELPSSFPSVQLVDACEFRAAGRRAFTVVTLGQRLVTAGPISQQARNGVLKVILMRPLHGGGPGGAGKNGKKIQQQEKALSLIAKLLLEKGCTVANAQQQAQHVCLKLGAHTIGTVMAETNPAKQWKLLTEASALKGFHLLPREALLTQSANVIQKMVRKKQQEKVAVPMCSGLVLQDGWFFNADGSPCTLHKEITPGCSGVALVDLQAAKGYLDNPGTISADEFALVIPCQPDVKPPRGTLIRAPVKDIGGQSAIIAAIMLQVGEKQVAFGKTSNVVVKTEPITTVQFMAYRDHHDPGTWQSIIEAPVKAIFARFDQALIREGVQRVWGRVFFDGRTRCQAEKADSFSCFVAVKDDKLANILQQSGVNDIFCRPRVEGSQIDPRFAVVWCPDKVTAQTCISKFPHHRGMAFNMTGFGVRVIAADEAKMFAMACPDNNGRSRFQ